MDILEITLKGGIVALYYNHGHLPDLREMMLKGGIVSLDHYQVDIPGF